MIPWMRRVTAQPNGYNPLHHAIFFSLYIPVLMMFIICKHMLFVFFWVAIAQFGGAIGGIVGNRCKFNTLEYIQAQSLINLTFWFFYLPSLEASYQGKEAVRDWPHSIPGMIQFGSNSAQCNCPLVPTFNRVYFESRWLCELLSWSLCGWFGSCYFFSCTISTCYWRNKTISSQK